MCRCSKCELIISSTNNFRTKRQIGKTHIRIFFFLLSSNITSNISQITYCIIKNIQLVNIYNIHFKHFFRFYSYWSKYKKFYVSLLTAYSPVGISRPTEYMLTKYWRQAIEYLHFNDLRDCPCVLRVHCNSCALRHFGDCRIAVRCELCS